MIYLLSFFEFNSS